MPEDIPEAGEVIKALDQMSEEWVTSEEGRRVMSDPRIAALAEAITAAHPNGAADHPGPGCAAAILAALDAAGYTVARKPQLEGVEWLPIEGDELARLRKIEEAAREMVAAYRDIEGDVINGRTDLAFLALRAALEADHADD